MKKIILPALVAASLSGCLMYEDRQYVAGSYPVSKDEVIQMTRNQVPDEKILGRINQYGVDRRATADDLVEMREMGVSSRVLAGFTEAPVREARPGTEVRTRYYYDVSEPVVDFGLGVLTGYLIWRYWCR